MKSKYFIRGALFIALLSASSLIRIPTPAVPLTFTVQILLIGALVADDIKTPVASVCMYLFMGIAGLPVFSFGGGLAALTSPTVGFLLGYIPCVAAVSILSKCGEVLCCVLSVLALYICGVVGFLLVSEFCLGGIAISLSSVLALFFCMLVKDMLLIFPVVAVSRRIRKAVA